MFTAMGSKWNLARGTWSTQCFQVWAPSTEALAVTDTRWLPECSELKVLAWGHSANDVFVNVQTLMGAVERGNSGGSEGEVFCSLIWPFEKESYEAQLSLGVTT